MSELTIKNNLTEEKVIEPERIITMCDDRCCGHCTHYDGNGYCSDGTPVRSTDWCKDFRWAE